jgi:TatD DNase family protein
MRLVDTHCHLTEPPLLDDLDGVLARASAAGVDEVVVPAYDTASWATVAEVAASHPGLHPAYGLHPWVADEELCADELELLLRTGGAVAVGEIGLDFKLETFDRERQLEVLHRQLALAVDLGLPVLLHCRGAFPELTEAVARFVPRLEGIVHAYSRGPEPALRFVELGLHIAFGGALTRANARRARRTASVVPLDRVVLETDAPSIGLDGVPPEAAEPRHVRQVAAALADLRGEALETVAAVTTATAHDLFRL